MWNTELKNSGTGPDLCDFNSYWTEFSHSQKNTSLQEKLLKLNKYEVKYSVPAGLNAKSRESCG
jgi:hypothetical protein